MIMIRMKYLFLRKDYYYIKCLKFESGGVWSVVLVVFVIAFADWLSVSLAVLRFSSSCNNCRCFNSSCFWRKLFNTSNSSRSSAEKQEI